MDEEMFIRRSYGWKRDTPDHRDKLFFRAINPLSLPDVYDGSAHLPAVLDQSRLSACTAHAILEAYRYERLKKGLPDKDFSRLQLYFDERTREGTTKSDCGAMIRDGVKCLNYIGVADESLWPYDITKFDVKPTDDVYQDAKQDVAVTYSRVNVSTNDVKTALISGHPVIIGISVFASFESREVAASGIVPMPKPDEAPLGGHAMLVHSYGQMPGYFTVRNSWSNKWGKNGDCFIPYDYIGSPNYGADYWIIEEIKSLD